MRKSTLAKKPFSVQAKKCPNHWMEFNRSCYQFQFEKLSWSDADELCKNKSGELASIHSKQEYYFIVELSSSVLGPPSYVWLGGQDLVTEGSWTWSDGSAWDFQLAQFTLDGGKSQNCL